ncbi:MAG: FxsA family protein, partial [Candidatus Bipolaricaulota bacterium]|nr:FxsA family protein [Candidatus Bipolaricaulota bacterium]
QAVGGGPVLGEILLSGVLGLILLQVTGRSVLKNVAVNVFVGRLSLQTLLRHDLSLLLAGILLILPGLFSDAYALYLIARYLYEGPHREKPSPSQQGDGPIDIDYQVHDEEPRK